MDWTRTGMFAVACAMAMLAKVPEPAAAPIHIRPEGEWILVEQTYGKGKANLADKVDPLYLELFRQDGRLSGRLRRGRDAERRWDWPSLVEGDRARPVQNLASSEDPARGSFEFRYTIPPAPGDDLFLDVVESYRLEEEGTALSGRIEIAFRRHGEGRGSYVLHRRFERIQ